MGTRGSWGGSWGFGGLWGHSGGDGSIVGSKGDGDMEGGGDKGGAQHSAGGPHVPLTLKVTSGSGPGSGGVSASPPKRSSAGRALPPPGSPSVRHPSEVLVNQGGPRGGL